MDMRATQSQAMTMVVVMIVVVIVAAVAMVVIMVVMSVAVRGALPVMIMMLAHRSPRLTHGRLRALPWWPCYGAGQH
jgi:hypothetical protein